MASSSSSHHPKIKYDLFISFRGKDTRHSFLSHLIKDLRQKKIDVYDDERLERGDEISHALLEAIESSAISLVLFSKNYASSTWCLDELVKIFECKRRYKQIVIPVFYNIDPSDVRHQTGTYENAFAKHEKKFEENMVKVRNWRSTLKEVADLSGFHLSLNFEKEAEFIDEIVKDILQKLNNIYPISESSNKFVGIHERIADLDPKLSSCNNNVHVIGIWGMGGIGKTAIAKALFHRMLSKYEFEGCYFLENVREKLDKYGLAPLQNEIISVLVEKINQRFGLPIVECTYNMVILHRKRVLLVLDDVNDTINLSDLYAGHGWFGQGSVIIVTSRDKQVLISNCEADFIYEVQGLSVNDSLKLFSSYAFQENYPKMKWQEELSMEVVDYAKGNPLAIKVFGYFLRGKGQEQWESQLEKLKQIPNRRIMNVLRSSYDELEHPEQDIFLYLACFFKRNGVAFDYIKLLDACGYLTCIGVSNLVDKALMVVKKGFGYWNWDMHNLIQEMGLEIVRGQSNDPRQRYHLWDPYDICQALRDVSGTAAIQSITLNISSESEDLYLSPEAFKGMVNLKFLHVSRRSTGLYSYLRWPEERLNFGWAHQRKIFLSKGYLESLPDGLRLFSWDSWPLKFLPSGFRAKNLVELHLKGSRLKKLWDDVQDLGNLKKIDFGYSKHLIELPDFSKALNLETVLLDGCQSLRYLHPSMLSLHKIVEISVSRCIQLESLRSDVHLKSLKRLVASFCSSLKEFSVTSEKLVELDLSLTAIKEMPSLGLAHRKLEELNDQLSTSLQNLPPPDDFLKQPNISELRKSTLNLFSTFISRGLETLTYLNLSGSNIESLPTTIKHCSLLEYLFLHFCKRLRSLPELPQSIQYFGAANCESLEKASSWSVEPGSRGPHTIIFENCIKLSKHSLDRIMSHAFVKMKQAIYVDQYMPYEWKDDIAVALPGSKLPVWDGLISTTDASMTVELATPSNLMGFICCCVLSPCREMNDRVEWTLDSETIYDKPEWAGFSPFGKPFDKHHYNRADVVLLYYSKWFSKNIMNKIRQSSANNQYYTTYIPKISFECSVWNVPTGDVSKIPNEKKYNNKTGKIKEWGMVPIYASSIFRFGNSKKRKRQTDDFELLQLSLPPTKKLKIERRDLTQNSSNYSLTAPPEKQEPFPPTQKLNLNIEEFGVGGSHGDNQHDDQQPEICSLGKSEDLTKINFLSSWSLNRVSISSDISDSVAKVDALEPIDLQIGRGSYDIDQESLPPTKILKQFEAQPLPLLALDLNIGEFGVGGSNHDSQHDDQLPPSPPTNRLKDFPFQPEICHHNEIHLPSSSSLDGAAVSLHISDSATKVDALEPIQPIHFRIGRGSYDIDQEPLPQIKKLKRDNAAIERRDLTEN